MESNENLINVRFKPEIQLHMCSHGYVRGEDYLRESKRETKN